MPGFTANAVTLSGNLTRDPELRQAGDASVCSLRIASNDRAKDSNGNWIDKPGYYSISIWRGLGEWVAGNVKKGDQVVITGRLRWREWEKDGQKHESIDITADTIIPVTRRNGTGPARENPDVRTTFDTDIPADTTGLGTEPASTAEDDDIPF